MKRTFFILFVLSVISAHAQKQRETAMYERFNRKPIEFIFDEQGRRVDKETGALRLNRNVIFRTETEETCAATIAWAYLEANKNVYELNLDNVKISHTIKSPSGSYVYFRQHINDIPVVRTNFMAYINRENVVAYTLNEFRNADEYSRNISSVSLVDSNDALKIANEYLDIKRDVIANSKKAELVYFESMDRGLELAWKTHVNSMEHGSWRIFVSASDGRIIHAESTRISANANGTGNVFLVNPLISAGVPYGYNNCFLHNNGATNPCLDGELVQVVLRDLTFENGVYKLKGPYCRVVELQYPLTHIPELSTPNFNFTREDEEFGAVMAYYHVDLAARRILELGYDIPDGLKGLRIDPHGAWGFRTAYYCDTNNYIILGSEFGSGNTFIAAVEDADVIWHEYGHAMQWNFGAGNMDWNNWETAALLEGSSDYWAVSYKRSLFPNNWAVLGLWFEMGGTIRRADLNWIYPQDFIFDQGRQHRNGQIWSSALMKIWTDLGRDITDQLFLETHLIWGMFPTMRDGASAFMQADIHLNNGIHLCQIFGRFREHGLVDPNGFTPTISFVEQTVDTNETIATQCNISIQNVTITNNAKLTLDTPGKVIFTGDVQIVSGALVIQ